MFRSAVILVLFFLAVVGLFAIALPHRPHVVTRTSCGSTSAEARASGCVFDVMSFSWHQPACFDEELTNEFLSVANWTWFEDEDAKITLSEAEVVAGNHPVTYVAREYHLAHCTYMWRKLHRAVLRNGPIDGHIGEYEHTKYCGEMLLMAERGTSANATNTIATTKYPTCGYASV